MTNRKRRKIENPLEFFLDNLLTDDEQASFVSESEDPQMLKRTQQLQSKIDESLERTFAVRPLSDNRIDQIARRVELAGSAKTKNWHYSRMIRVALAASLIGTPS